jgi:hypothetical protein
MAVIDVSRHLLVRPTVAQRRLDHAGAPAPEHTRAGIALAVAWAGLAVVFGVHAIAERSVWRGRRDARRPRDLARRVDSNWSEEDPRSPTMEQEIHLLT